MRLEVVPGTSAVADRKTCRPGDGGEGKTMVQPYFDLWPSCNRSNLRWSRSAFEQADASMRWELACTKRSWQKCEVSDQQQCEDEGARRTSSSLSDTS